MTLGVTGQGFSVSSCLFLPFNHLLSSRPLPFNGVLGDVKSCKLGRWSLEY